MRTSAAVEVIRSEMQPNVLVLPDLSSQKSNLILVTNRLPKDGHCPGDRHGPWTVSQEETGGMRKV